MASVRYPMEVEMEDGAKHTVEADQRDVAEWEMQPFGTSGNEMGQRIHLAMRFMAWHCLRRTNRTKLTWEKFNLECIEVHDAAPAGGGGDVDPGMPARSDES
jgi:hypothetical protein